MLLLDTNAIVHLAEGLPMREAAFAEIEAAGRAGAVLVSPVGAREVGLLAARGRPPLSPEPRPWFDTVLARPGVRLAPLTPSAALLSAFPGTSTRTPPNGASRAWLGAVLRREAGLLLSVPLVLRHERVGRPLQISFLWRPTLRDPGDEMVLEAAMGGRGDRLLTFSSRDFAGGERPGATIERPGPAWRGGRT